MTDKAMGTAARGSLVERLFRAFSIQLSDIETRIAEKTGDGLVEDARVLSGLAKTLETLVSVERKLVGEGGDEVVDMAAVRTELAERLAKLRLGFGGEDDGAVGEPA